METGNFLEGFRQISLFRLLVIVPLLPLQVVLFQALSEVIEDVVAQLLQCLAIGPHLVIDKPTQHFRHRGWVRVELAKCQVLHFLC